MLNLKYLGKMNLLKERLVLPCGVSLKNRIVKSAMSENMASKGHFANQKFVNLYRRWSAGGAGLLITGNVMVDSKCLGELHNVVIEKVLNQAAGANSEALQALRLWASAGITNDTQLWMQINHPGKQSPKFLSVEPVSSSAVPLKAPLNRLFNTPRALSETEIFEIIERFVYCAKVAKECGFTGVQIHGAHGYLVSQFLSPLHNIRTDQWGGSETNRMRFVLEIYRRLRAELGSCFPIGIKLNSADFQKGGFTEDESMQVVLALAEAGIDLIEISGGNYEAPEMMGAKAASTQAREAYFLDYAERLRAKVKTPLLLTGGFRSQSAMIEALETQACDLIGLGRSLVLNPEFANDLLVNSEAGTTTRSLVKPLTTGFKKLDRLLPLEIIWYTEQIHRIANGYDPKPTASPLLTVVSSLLSAGAQSLKRVRAKA